MAAKKRTRAPQLWGRDQKSRRLRGHPRFSRKERGLCLSRLIAAIPLPVAIFLSGCAQPTSTPPPLRPPDPSGVVGAQAMSEVANFVALGPRIAGTDGAAKAAEYLVGRLEALGVEAATDVFNDDAPGGQAVFRNVTGLLPGSTSNLVVLVSHYDTKHGIGDTFVGANDSGSSTGLLLHLADLLHRQASARPDVLLAFVDGEECRTHYTSRDGLHGSRRLAQRLKMNGEAGRVAAVIVLDMIGDGNLTVDLPRNSTPALVSLVFRAAREEGVRETFALSGKQILDDHVPFLLAGMPAVDIIDFEYGSAPGLNDYWHTTADTMDKLRAESLAVIGRVVLRMVGLLANEES